MRVPTFRRRVLPQAAPNVALPAAGNAAGNWSGGGGTTDLVFALAQRSQDAEDERRKVYEDEKRKADRVAAQEFANQVAQRRLADFTDPETGFDYAKGRALFDRAEGAEETFLTWVAEQYDRLTPSQQFLAQQDRDREIQMYGTRLNGRLGTERQEYAQNTLDSTLGLTLDSAVDLVGSGPDAAQIGFGGAAKIRQHLEQFAEDNPELLDTDADVWVETRYRDQVNQLHDSVVRRLVANGDSEQAAEYVERFRNDMTPETGTRLIGQIRVLDEATTARSVADTLWDPLDIQLGEAAQKADGWVEPERALEQARKDLRTALREKGLDEAVIDAEEESLLARGRNQIRAAKDAQESLAVSVLEEVDASGGDVATVFARNAGLMGQLSTGQISDIKARGAQLRGENDERAAQNALHEYRLRVYSPDEKVRAEAARENLTLKAGRLGSHFENAIKLQQDLLDDEYQRKGGGRQNEARVKLMVEDLGYDDDPDEELRFRAAVDAAVYQWEVDHGKRIGAVEHSSLLNDLVKSEVMVRATGGVIDTDGTPLYRVQPESLDLEELQQVAPDAMRAAKWALWGRSQEVTEPALQKSMLRWLMDGQPPIDVSALPAGEPPTAEASWALADPTAPAGPDNLLDVDAVREGVEQYERSLRASKYQTPLGGMRQSLQPSTGQRGYLDLPIRLPDEDT